MFLLEIIEVLGKPSEDWWSCWENGAAGLSITRREVVDSNDGAENLERVIDDLDNEDFDKELLKYLLKCMVTLEPEERLSINEVHEHAWFRSL